MYQSQSEGLCSRAPLGDVAGDSLCRLFERTGTDRGMKDPPQPSFYSVAVEKHKKQKNTLVTA